MKISQTILISCACFALSGCMSQETATRQMTQEFVEEFPNHPKTEIYERVVGWVSKNPNQVGSLTEYQTDEAGSIICNGDTHIKPEGSLVNMRIGFTMSVDVKNEKMRIRFTHLRRLYGSKNDSELSNDAFFSSPTGAPYHHAAHARFNNLAQSLTYFILHRTGDVASK